MEQEVAEWLQRAQRELETCEKNLEIEEYHVVVSRAYYAMFYAATAALLSREIRRKRHSGVVSAFAEHFVKSGEIEADVFHRFPGASEDRLTADYDSAPVLDFQLAQDRLEDATVFVHAIAAILR